MKTKIRIVIATHKKIDYKLPKCYYPMQINCKNNKEHWDGFLHDDFGDNISIKNKNYCELTAQYNLWKNYEDEIKGLCHYRRFFSKGDSVLFQEFDTYQANKLSQKIISEKEINKILENYECIVAMPYRPFPNTEKQDILNYCYQKDVDILRKTIAEIKPDYLKTYDRVMDSMNLSHYNMLITRKKIFDEYSAWLFEILEKVEAGTNIEFYDTQHKRIYGYFAEILLNVYLLKNAINCKYLRIAEVAEYTGVSKKMYYSHLAKRGIISISKLILGEKVVNDVYKRKNKQFFERKIACQNAVLSESRKKDN